jgi:hypothetical protein
MVYAARLAGTAGQSPGRSLVLVTRRPEAREAISSGLLVERPGRPPHVRNVDALTLEKMESRRGSAQRASSK